MRHFCAAGQDVCVNAGLTIRHSLEVRRRGGRHGATSQEARPGSRTIPARAQRPRPAGPRLSVGFILARRFTLCAFANFVDVLRLAADEGDRSRPILCDWSVLSDTMDPVPSSCGVTVQPGERLGDPARFDYIVVVGGLLEEIPNISPAYTALPRARGGGGRSTRRPLHRRLHPATAGLMQGYRACVSWFCHADFLEQFDGLDPISDQIFVVEGTASPAPAGRAPPTSPPISSRSTSAGRRRAKACIS